MFLIFGTQGLKRKTQDEPILSGICPNCGSGDLEPKTYRNWFTLFFIPVFPIASAKLIYECNQCGASYDERIREYIQEITSVLPKEESLNPELYYSRALIASLTFLVQSESSTSSKGMYLIDKLIFGFSGLTEELQALKKSIISQGNTENQVFEYLYEAKDVLSSEELWKMFIELGNLLSNLPNLSTEQETLIKDYLIACGFPKSKYQQIIKS